MRILMTTDTIGGVWTFTQELTRGLLHNGCAVALISFGANPSEAQQNWCRDITRAWGSAFHYQESDIPLEWMPENRAAYSDAAPLFMSIARKFKPDILLSNQYCFGALPLSIPRILVAHSDVLSWADHTRGGNLEHSEWLTTYCSLVSNGLEQADSLVSPTQWMLNALAQHFTIPDRTSVIPNGRTLSASRVWPRKLQAVTAGRLWDQAKNISILRNVQSPNPLLIAGDIAQISFSEPRFATFLGRLPEQDLLTIFRESSIYICTSIYEPFGLAPLEAAQCGCAVVANDIPSLREVWQDAALYFSDAASLTTLLHELSLSPELLHAAQQRSFERAAAFTGKRMVQAYMSLFQATLAQTEQQAYAS
ncbi:MAG: glycosyltransferase family 4 protein [Acidobacteriaceae bacterium]